MLWLKDGEKIRSQLRKYLAKNKNKLRRGVCAAPMEPRRGKGRRSQRVGPVTKSSRFRTMCWSMVSGKITVQYIASYLGVRGKKMPKGCVQHYWKFDERKKGANTIRVPSPHIYLIPSLQDIIFHV